MENLTRAEIVAAVESFHNDLIEAMTSGVATTQDIAIKRKKWDLVNDAWTNRPDGVIRLLGRKVLIGGKPELLAWYDSAIEKTATEMVAYEKEHMMEWFAKGDEYDKYITRIAHDFNYNFQWYENPYTGKVVTYEANLQTPKYTQILRNEFMKWYEHQIVTPQFLRQTARDGYVNFLLERPDMIVLLQAIHALANERHVRQEDIKRPVAVEAVEFALALVPVVGNAIALYESWAGEDLFGYKLTNLERGVLAASVMLPLAGRVFKGGRALYTEARLVKLYGSDAAGWSRVIKSSARASEQKASTRALQAADDALRVSKKLEGKVAQEAADALPKILHSNGVVGQAVEKEVTSVWEVISKKYPALSSLDEIALRRVLAKGNLDHIRGQLLEELLESQILPLLRSRQGAFALGLRVPKGKAIEFVAGHSIHSASGKVGRQITDGMLGYWEKDVFNILAIFEAKAGRDGARELSFLKGSLEKLTAKEKKELRAYAKEIMAEEKEIAEDAGRLYSRTVEDIEKEVIHEEPGQIRRDLERLDATVNKETGANILPKIRIGSREVEVKLNSISKTKIFGIVPKGVRISTIQKEVPKEFLFEAIAAPIHRKDLQAVANDLVGLAEKLNSP
ncbi:hypothetical protein BGZ60DRAFT_436208 [Tricladium varicosporioides]|nr:hypothetical protein BGZ60DRAFT_436208 [Hymenoscyphus varicosporioides]